jgi:hypothetical protein
MNILPDFRVVDIVYIYIYIKNMIFLKYISLTKRSLCLQQGVWVPSDTPGRRYSPRTPNASIKSVPAITDRYLYEHVRNNAVRHCMPTKLWIPRNNPWTAMAHLDADGKPPNTDRTLEQREMPSSGVTRKRL